MPANLNALIRYKTINSCFYGGRRWTIKELIDACSDALAEYRGRDENISERTVRDDLSVMKSDILGFNAPIMQNKGYYYYSDPAYSIMTISLTDSELLDQIISFLKSIRTELNHPELEIILNRLTGVSIKKRKVKSEIEEDIMDEIAPYKRVRISEKSKPVKKVRMPDEIIEDKLSDLPPDHFESHILFSFSVPETTTWGDVLKLIR